MKSILFKISGVLILLSALLYMFYPAVAPWIMAFSVAVFSAITVSNPYPGKSIRGKRLFNLQILSCLLMIAATYLMFKNRSEWVLVMVAGAVFLLYSAFVLPIELDKENRGS
jgi:phosphatidylglycerophosphate synthase